MPDPLETLFEEGLALTAMMVECEDCGFECKGWIQFGFDPNLKLECAQCKSRNTTRRPVDA